jgi:hypothetical protein
LQAGTIDSAWFLDVSRSEAYQRLTNYTLTITPSSTTFEALYFNFHNTVLVTHLEVRQAIAMAIDHQALTDFPFIVLYSSKDIAMVRKGTHNYQPGPIGASETINIWEWWCDNGKC